jgi:hypothetical protein
MSTVKNKKKEQNELDLEKKNRGNPKNPKQINQ